MEEHSMAKINLRDFYPFYNSDFFVEIPDEIKDVLLEAERLEQNYIRRRFYNKAHYSLDIARAEGVNESAVRDSIEKGLKNMEIFLEKAQFSPANLPFKSHDY